MCHLSQTPTATSTDPHPANSPTLHSRQACQKPKPKIISKSKKLSKPPIKRGFLFVQS